MSAVSEVILPLLTISLVLFFFQQTMAGILQRADGNLVSKWGYHFYPQVGENLTGLSISALKTQPDPFIPTA